MGCAKETTSEKLRKEAERKRIYRAKQKAKKEAASNSTQAETSNAQTPTPSSTASIYEPTAFPLTPLNPVSAERNDQLPTSSLISSSFKKRPRGMNPEELKQHNRERTKLWRAKRAATEAASNSTQAKTSNAQPPTPSSTAPIVEPTPAPSTPVTPAPAESYAQLPTSSSMNSLDASSTDKFETISGKPSKKRLKDMNPEERKQYNREKSALSRAKKAATGIDKMLNVAVSDSCAAPLSSTDNVSLNSLGFDGTSAENDIGTTEEPTTKRWRDMNATERKEYKRLNKKTCRAKKAASCVDHDAVSLRSLDTDASDSHSVAASTSTRASNKRRNSQTPAESRKCDAKRRADLYADITALLDNHEEEINFPGDESTTEAGNMNMTSCMPEKTVPVIKPPQSSERPSGKYINPYVKFKTKSNIPITWELVVVILSTVIVSGEGLRSQTQVVEQIPVGVPEITVPAFWLIPKILPDALSITLVNISVWLSVSKMLAQEMDYGVDSEQELYALSITSVASSFIPSLPISCSLSRTLVAVGAGLATQLSCREIRGNCQTQTPPEMLSRHFIVDCSGFTFIDLMGVSALKQIFSEMRKFFEFVPKENFYPTMRDANSIARMRQLELGFQDGGYVPEHDRISEVISSHPM
ncbi:unnamed protein product [Caenorhabditis brenneri]